MKTKEKEAVLELLASHPKTPKARYKVLVEKLMELPGATPAQKRFYNAALYSPVNLNSLEYDLKKLCGITDHQVKKLKLEKKAPAPKTGQERLLDFNPEGDENYLRQEAVDLVEFSKLQLPDNLPEFSKGLPGNAERKQWLSDKQVEHSFTRKVDLQALIEKEHEASVDMAYAVAIDNLKEAKETIAKEIEVKAEEEAAVGVLKTFETAPEEVKQAVKLRDEFPFLNDADCPDEFKILVADKFTAYNNFVEGREELKALVALGASNDDLFEIAQKTVKEFKLNLDIYDELNYYKEHKQILGKHPIFAEKMLEASVNALGTVELTKRQKNLRSYISRDQKAFNKMEEGEAKDNFGKKIETWQAELDLVDARLDKIS